VYAPVRKSGQRRNRGLDPIDPMGGPGRRVVFGDPSGNLLEVADGRVRQQDLESHQRRDALARTRRNASAAGVALPCSISRLPSARIFSSARVSCVAS